LGEGVFVVGRLEEIVGDDLGAIRGFARDKVGIPGILLFAHHRGEQIYVFVSVLVHKLQIVRVEEIDSLLSVYCPEGLAREREAAAGGHPVD